jgi:hypothetical protein
MAEKEDKNTKFRLLTPEFRVSHPHIFKPSQMIDPRTKQPKGPLSYSIEMLFDKKTTDLSVIQAPVKAAAIGQWGSKENWPKGMMLPIRDGDKPYGTKKEIKKEHKGMWVVRASTNAEYSKPHVVGRDPKVALESEAEFYPGCYARASLKSHAYEVGVNSGVKFILDGVQFIRDGEAFGGKRPADQVFGTIAGDDGDPEMGMEVDGEDDNDSFM